MSLRYEEYAWRPEYKGVPQTYGGFAIIPGRVENRPAVCIKQRNGKGSLPYQFDLPGGGMHTDSGDALDPDLRAACEREVLEEVGVECEVLAAIGRPLYLPIRKDGVLVKVDCAQAFSVNTYGRTLAPSEEALVIAFVHQQSFAGFNVVSRKADPSSPVFGRTPIMIWDGLSIKQDPFYRGPFTDELRAAIVAGDPNGKDVLLLDEGNYLGLPHRVASLRWIYLWYRLNPDQPDGRFHGAFDHLAR
jgi:8-oxo-dGTP pyrophosphatase MutT (NUDIX family)